jgi:hypothetical protein
MTGNVKLLPNRGMLLSFFGLATYKGGLIAYVYPLLPWYLYTKSKYNRLVHYRTQKKLLRFTRDKHVMVIPQITRRKNADNSETLIKHIDGTTLPYSGANLTTILTGVTNPIFVLKKISSNGNAYPFTLQARNQRVHNCKLRNGLGLVPFESS